MRRGLVGPRADLPDALLRVWEHAVNEGVHCAVYCSRVAQMWRMTSARDFQKIGTAELSNESPLLDRHDGVELAMDHQDGTANPFIRPRVSFGTRKPPLHCVDQDLRVRVVAHATASSICLVEWASGNTCAKKNRTKSE